MVMVTITQVWFPSSLLSGWLWVTPLFRVRFIPVTHSEVILYWTYVRFGHNNSLLVYIVIQLCDRQTDRQRTEIFSVVDYFSGRTRSSSLVTLARPSISSSLQTPTALSRMHHLTCGISSLLHSVNLILFTVLLVHLILHISPQHSHHLHSHHLSLPLPFTPDLKLISFTNAILHSHSYSFQTDFTYLNLYWIKGALLCLF